MTAIPSPGNRPARLRLVADDFAQHGGIDESVIELAAAGRLHGTSCLVTAPRWPEAARALRGLPAGFGVGLHFNLTEGVPLSPDLRRHWPRFPGLGRVLALGLARALPGEALAAEWQAQFDAFTDATGHAPAHLDGHQHVHALPQVRPLVLATATSAAPRLQVRSTARLAGPGGRFKQRVIEACGGRALGQALARQGLPHNAVLLGAYGFGAGNDFAALMRAWLAVAASGQGQADGGALLFCHPARHAPADDPIGPARLREHAHLAGDAFAADWQAAFGQSLAPSPGGSSSGG